MDLANIVQKTQTLSDVELAMLLSLMAGQHCQIETDTTTIDLLEDEIRLMCSDTFAFTRSTIQCSSTTTLDDFRNSLLTSHPLKGDDEALNTPKGGNQRLSTSKGSGLPTLTSIHQDPESMVYRRSTSIPNVAIVRNISQASYNVQIQALELMRTRRIFTHTSVQSAPKMFLVLLLRAETDPPLVAHLNDHIFISHYFDAEVGYRNMEKASPWIEDDRVSLSSVVHRSAEHEGVGLGHASISAEEISALMTSTSNISMTAEVKAYLQNIVTFIRMHRAVAGGISPRATQHFTTLVKCLAPLHSLAYVTPSLVLLAAHKIYPHRIILTKPENERSMQYGSDIHAVTALLEGYTPERVIEEVLAEVDAPA